jgi:type IV pilus assembly protein PilB
MKLGQKKRLGEMLIDGGLLTDAQLSAALADQKKTGLKLGQFLVREGIVSESQIVKLLSRQLNIEIYQPEKYPIDMGLAKIIPMDLARKHQIVPLAKSGYLLTVAVADPMDLNAIDAVEVHTNSEVEVVICTEQEVNQLISSIYGSFSGLSLILGDMEAPNSEEISAAPAGVSVEDIEVNSLQDMAAEAPVIRLVNSVLSQAISEGASDVHISPEKNSVQIRFRVDGKLREVPAPPKHMFLPFVSRLKVLSNMDIALSRVPQDGRFTIQDQNKEINVRSSTIPTIYGENLVLRLLDTSAGVLTFDQMGMSADDQQKIASMIDKPYGLILTTGPTGCGKTTSLYSILKKVNRPDIHVITLEDPVEYRIDKIRQAQLNRKAGMTFADGLRAILRQDPDVIMVGEIRDAETARIAVQAALTGHRVLSTVHTNDAAGAITRFIDMGIEPFLVSTVMLVSIAQRLVRKVCDNCKQPYEPPPAALKQWGLDQFENARFYHGTGCLHCLHTGFKGRTGIYEVLIIDEMIQEMIIARKSAQEITRAAQKSGCLRTLKEGATAKVAQGLTTLEEAASAIMT